MRTQKMNQGQIQKLNSYLNDIILMLNKEDSYLLHNLRKFIYASENYLYFAQKNLNLEDKSVSTYLTFEQVYALGREVIETYCPCYLEEYDNILPSGILDLSYENEYMGSHCYSNAFNQKFEINLNRQFHYEDVVMLIHEFMHYTNCKKDDRESHHLLTEFISIYFEMKTVMYLMEEKEILPNEVLRYERLKMTRQHARNFNRYSFPLTMYVLFGKIDLEYIGPLVKYLSPYSINEEQFTNECILFLNKMEEMEKTYCEDYLEEERSQESWEAYIHENAPFAWNYKYLLGSFLTFYALEHCSVSDIIKVNRIIGNFKYDDSINYEENGYDCEVEKILCSIGIDINDSKVLIASIESMQHFIENYSEIKRK